MTTKMLLLKHFHNFYLESGQLKSDLPSSYISVDSVDFFVKLTFNSKLDVFYGDNIRVVPKGSLSTSTYAGNS